MGNECYCHKPPFLGDQPDISVPFDEEANVAGGLSDRSHHQKTEDGALSDLILKVRQSNIPKDDNFKFLKTKSANPEVGTPIQKITKTSTMNPALDHASQGLLSQPSFHKDGTASPAVIPMTTRTAKVRKKIESMIQQQQIELTMKQQTLDKLQIQFKIMQEQRCKNNQELNQLDDQIANFKKEMVMHRTIIDRQQKRLQDLE